MSRYRDFGKEVGLMHQVLFKARKFGWGRLLWKLLSEDEDLLKKTIEFMYAQPVLTVEILQGGTLEDMIKGTVYDHNGLGSNGGWKLEESSSAEIPFSFIFVPEQSSEKQIRERMKIHGLRPANTRELLSLGKNLRENVSGFSSKALLDKDVETHLIALNAENNQSTRGVMGIHVRATPPYLDMSLNSYSPQPDGSEGIWRWSVESRSIVKFLAVPEDV